MLGFVERVYIYTYIYIYIYICNGWRPFLIAGRADPASNMLGPRPRTDSIYLTSYLLS